jgi:elongation factor G
VGDIMGDLSSKRAIIQGSEKVGNATRIKAEVPLAEVAQGYITTIRSMSQGRATVYMEPSHYAEVPGNIAQKVVAASGFTGRIDR